MIKIVQLTSDSREHYKDYGAPLPSFGTAPAALIEGFAGMHDVEVHVICCLRKSVISPTKIADNIYYHSIVIPKLGWGRTLFLGCVFAVRKLLREIQPDIVHGQGSERDCAISAILSGFPNVLTIHGHMARIAEIVNAKPFSYYWLVKHLESLAISRTDGVVAITNYTKERIEGGSEKVYLIPNAVDSSFFEVNAQGGENIVLCVASFSPWKRQLELIQAMDLIADSDRPELVFLGGGEESEYGERVSSAIRTRDWCSHAGEVNREELKKWLGKAGLLILPSIEDNCPMVILEAMAAGVPVAASAIGGIPDLIDGGRTGFLFDPQDPSSICKAILTWLNDPAAARAIAELAKHEASQRFHPKVVAARHLDVYKQVIAENKRKRRDL